MRAVRTQDNRPSPAIGLKATVELYLLGITHWVVEAEHIVAAAAPATVAVVAVGGVAAVAAVVEVLSSVGIEETDVGGIDCSAG